MLNHWWRTNHSIRILVSWYFAANTHTSHPKINYFHHLLLIFGCNRSRTLHFIRIFFSLFCSLFTNEKLLRVNSWVVSAFNQYFRWAFFLNHCMQYGLSSPVANFLLCKESHLLLFPVLMTQSIRILVHVYDFDHLKSSCCCSCESPFC